VFAGAALDRLRRKVKKHGRNLAEADDPARHEVRKDAKQLHYAAEFFAALFDRKQERRRYRHFIAALEGLQDELGNLNDLVTAPAILTGLGIGDPPGAMALLFPGNKTKLLDAAGDAHAMLIDAARFWR
jgi:CHAD domain-containing protein